jgi:GNAT superfamily N-acetyltransferase
LEGEDLRSPPPLPAGYVVRVVGDRVEDLRRRVEVHRAAFAPSRFTLERYRQARGSRSYRPELDIVVEAPDGSLAAFCLGWYDEESAVGELEPVGTHPVHRRKGLARAACLGALREIAAAGGDTAVVYHHAGSGAGDLYRSLGFEEFGRTLRFERR